MTKIITRRHPLKFYATLIFVVLFISALGTLILAFSIHLFKEESDSVKYILTIISFVLYILAFSMVYAYLKNSQKITVDELTITFGNQAFNVKDIENVELTGKMPFQFIIKFPMEGVSMRFIDGTEKFLIEDMYFNSWEIKSFIEQVVINKQEYKPYQCLRVNRNEVSFEKEEVFKGNQFTSFRGIFLWGLIVPFGYILILKIQTNPIWSTIFMGVFITNWFVLHSWLMHFFGLTKNILIIRNHNFIWMAKRYRLSDIKEIVFISLGQQPNSLKIITKDYKYRHYPAGTLRDKTWLEMKHKLEVKGVKVINECIYENDKNDE